MCWCLLRVRLANADVAVPRRRLGSSSNVVCHPRQRRTLDSTPFHPTPSRLLLRLRHQQGLGTTTCTHRRRRRPLLVPYRADLSSTHKHASLATSGFITRGTCWFCVASGRIRTDFRSQLVQTSPFDYPLRTSTYGIPRSPCTRWCHSAPFPSRISPAPTTPRRRLIVLSSRYMRTIPIFPPRPGRSPANLREVCVGLRFRCRLLIHNTARRQQLRSVSRFGIRYMTRLQDHTPARTSRSRRGSLARRRFGAGDPSPFRTSPASKAHWNRHNVSAARRKHTISACLRHCGRHLTRFHEVRSVSFRCSGSTLIRDTDHRGHLCSTSPFGVRYKTYAKAHTPRRPSCALRGSRAARRFGSHVSFTSPTPSRATDDLVLPSTNAPTSYDSIAQLTRSHPARVEVSFFVPFPRGSELVAHPILSRSPTRDVLAAAQHMRVHVYGHMGAFGALVLEVSLTRFFPFSILTVFSV